MIAKSISSIAFGARLASILKDNASERYVTRKRVGLLDKRRLSSVSHSAKLFKKREERQGLRYNVSILVDCSGSMNRNDKIHVASDSAARIAQHLGALGVNFEVVGFGLYDIILKPLSQKRLRKKELEKLRGELRYMSGAIAWDTPKYDYIPILYESRATSGRVQPYTAKEIEQSGISKRSLAHNAGFNSDGKVLHDAVNRLMPHDGKKIVIVLSDGQPASANYLPFDRKDTKTHNSFDLAQEVKRAIKNGITLLAVGIKSGSVQDYYPKENIGLVNDLDELYGTIAQLLANNIRRRE